MFLCELCGKDTGGKEPTANWTLTETFGETTLTFAVSATRKLCDECIKSFVVTKTIELTVTPEGEIPPEVPVPEEGTTLETATTPEPKKRRVK